MAEPVRVLSEEIDWEAAADIVVVGSSVSGLSVAVNAADLGASVIVLEAADVVGGTGRKAAAWAWVPNNRFMQEKGIPDSREDALRYLARFARPALFEEGHPTLGLPDWEYELFEAFYDNGDAALRSLENMGALELLHGAEYPNYYSHHPVDTSVSAVSSFRPCRMVRRATASSSPARWRRLRSHATSTFRTGHDVGAVFCNEQGEIIGVAGTHDRAEVRVRARRGVVFCTGGFSHNDELRRLYLGGLLLPGCSVRTNQGKFVAIAKRLGVPLLHMHAAYMAPTQLEWALDW